MDIRPEQTEFRRAERARGRDLERARGSQPERPDQAEGLGRGAELRALNARIKNARLENAEADRIDLSEGARTAEALSDGGTPPDRLAALRELYQRNELNSPERLQVAAERILGKRAEL